MKQGNYYGWMDYSKLGKTIWTFLSKKDWTTTSASWGKSNWRHWLQGAQTDRVISKPGKWISWSLTVQNQSTQARWKIQGNDKDIQNPWKVLLTWNRKKWCFISITCWYMSIKNWKRWTIVWCANWEKSIFGGWWQWWITSYLLWAINSFARMRNICDGSVKYLDIINKCFFAY